jgi:predicted lipid-binding transport protein (Tim44 family)
MIPARTQTRDSRRVAPHNAEPHPAEVVPFGRYGGGLLTGHPIGLVIVLGVILMGLIGIPEARLFFAASMVLGALFGLFLWLRHR